MAKKYWVAIVEVDTGHQQLPVGYDGPMRSAIANQLGKDAIHLKSIYSGWGANKEQASRMLNVMCSAGLKYPVGHCPECGWEILEENLSESSEGFGEK